MNPIDLIREKLESCFIFCSYAAPEIRYELGIKHLSQVWTAKPSWYFWLEDVDGAFMMELQGGAEFTLHGVACKGAAGVIRYFPPADYTGQLTDEECELIAHGVFDTTTTPHWEQIGQIAGTDHFAAATIELHTAVESNDLFFVFEVTRPGLEGLTAERLFDRLVGMQTYALQTKPAGAYRWGKHGRAVVIGNACAGELFLRDYLKPEQLVTASNSDPARMGWEALAACKPVAAEGTGCCCCCH